ncbi:MAG: tyrosine-type recombinase/integrase [Bacteroidota bacterium]
MKLSEFYDNYLSYAEFNLRPKSVLSVRSSFKHLFAYRGDVTLAEIDSRFIDLFMIELMKKAPRGFRVYFRTIRASFNKAIEWNYIRINFFAKHRLPKQQKNEMSYFSEIDFLKLIESEKNSTLKDLFLLDFYTGLRLSEIQSLAWENVFLNEKYLIIGSKTFCTKSKKVRRVPLCEKATRLLESKIPKIYKAEGRNFVFLKSNSFPYSTSCISRKFKKHLRGAGYDENFSFHSIRHSTASNLARLGVPIPIIQEILGHGDIKTTMIYTHTNFADLVNSISAFDKNNLEKSEVCNGK